MKKMQLQRYVTWVTIRGFSMASTWLEEYKKTRVAKKRGLRKDLYRKENPLVQIQEQKHTDEIEANEEEEEVEIENNN